MTPERLAEIRGWVERDGYAVGNAIVRELLAHIDTLAGRRAELALPSMLHLPHRQARADAMTAHVMHLIRDFIKEDRERNYLREAHGVLNEAFYTSGIDAISDADRAKAGLAPRKEYGVTAQELRIIEAMRMEAMLKPFPSPIFPTPPKPEGTP